VSDEPQIAEARDPEALAELAAGTFTALASEAISEHGSFCVALSGGNTPRRLFERLGTEPFRSSVDWPRCEVFFSDERFVAPDSPESNFHLAQEALLSKVPVAEDSVYPIRTVGMDPPESAALYEGEIKKVVPSAQEQLPRFDLILLGLGPDGHTASLFPDTAALKVRDRLVVANYVPKLNAWRITFTYPLINAGAVVAFLVEGEEKAERVAQVLAGNGDLPAAGVRLEHGRLLWLLDRAAASRW
jgi:6-phosphogluconolactonase